MRQGRNPNRWRGIRALMLLTAVVAVGCGLFIEVTNIARLRKRRIAAACYNAALTDDLRAMISQNDREASELRFQVNELDIHLADLGLHILKLQYDVATWAEDKGATVDLSFPFPDKPIPKLGFVKDLLKIPSGKNPKGARSELERFETRWNRILDLHKICLSMRNILQTESARLKKKQISINEAIKNYNTLSEQRGLQKFVWENQPGAPDVPAFSANIPPLVVDVKPKK